MINTEENILKDLKINYKKIRKEEFSHSFTREKEAFESDADIIVFITQDVKIVRDDWLYYLTKDIIDGKVDACYSRQLCNNNTIEKYTRESNYPEKSRIVSKEDVKKLGLKTFFFSDASSAISNQVFKKLNGYDQKKLPISEDMYIAYKLIMNGYKIKYCSDNTDWFDEIFENGYSQEHNLSISGGSEKIRYLLSLGYLDNQGVMGRFGIDSST